MSDDKNTRDFDAEYERLTMMSVDNIFAELAPAGSAHDLTGRINDGKKQVKRLLENTQDLICKTYRNNLHLAEDGKEMAKLVADSIQAVVVVAGLKIPVIPVAVLLCKMGLRRLCPMPGSSA